MKKSLIFTFMFLSLISLASAFYTEPVLFMQKTNYQPGETLIARLEGNFVQNLTNTNFKFSEGKKDVSLDYDFVNYEGVYYIAIYPQKEGNFTIKIQNILYKDLTLKSKTIIENITVLKKETNGTSQILSIKPGFFYGPENPRLVITNKGSSPLDVSYEKQKISLQPLESQNIFPDPVLGVSTLEITSYEKFSVPIIFLSQIPNNNQTQNNITLENQTQDPLIFSSLSFNLNSTENTPITKELKITNTGNSDITNMQLLSSNPSLSLSALAQVLPSNQTSSVNLTFLSSTQGLFSGNITLNYKYGKNQYSKIISFKFYSFSKQSIPLDKKNCRELNGNICVNQKCNGNYTFTSAGEYCCLGNCEAISVSTGGVSGWVTGLAIFVVLVIIGFFVWKKYKKAKPQTPKEELEKKSGMFEKRIQGGLARS